MLTRIPIKSNGDDTCIIIATGPSLNEEQISLIRDAHEKELVKVLTVNNAYKIAPFSDYHVSYNDNWWEHYMYEDDLINLRNRGCQMWTQHMSVADAFGINFIEGKQVNYIGTGLSKDPTIIHSNHGSGPMALNLATLYGYKRILLIGHDMKYPKGYNGRTRETGGKRHFFGEYPKSMQHWPKTMVGPHTGGVLSGINKIYGSMVNDLKDLNVDVINCTPESALSYFRLSDLKEELYK